MGPACGTAGALPRPARGTPAVLHPAADGSAVRVRGEVHLRRPLGGARLRPRWSRPDLHLLVAGRAPHGVPRHRAARAGALRRPRPGRVPEGSLLAHHVSRAGPRARAGRPGERRGSPGADHRGNPPAVPAQRRSGWGLPVGRTRLVRHGRRHRALYGCPLAHVLAALLRQRVRRGAVPEEDVRGARDPAPGHHGEPVRHRGGLPRGRPARRDPDPARGARTAVPALETGAGERLQGRGDGGGSRRGPRRVRPLPRGAGAPVLVAGPGIGEAYPGGGAALPVDGPVPGPDAGLRPQLLRPQPGPGRSSSLSPAAVGLDVGDQEHAVG